jgi:hypothetical protein
MSKEYKKSAPNTKGYLDKDGHILLHTSSNHQTVQTWIREVTTELMAEADVMTVAILKGQYDTFEQLEAPKDGAENKADRESREKKNDRIYERSCNYRKLKINAVGAIRKRLSRDLLVKLESLPEFYSLIDDPIKMWNTILGIVETKSSGNLRRDKVTASINFHEVRNFNAESASQFYT